MTSKKLISKLNKEKLSIALAESCSAGYASYLLTKTAGASKVFAGGIIVYSLPSKEKFFNIPSSTLKKTQGVSAAIATTLAKKVRKEFSSDIGASIVGFAGPTASKGVKAGTIFLGLSTNNNTLSKKIIIRGSRNQVRKKASSLLLELIYKNI